MNTHAALASQRVQPDYGAVETPLHIVESMCRIVPDIYAYHTRVFEPACGAGAFLVHILKEKLFRASLYTDNAKGRMCEALASIYGIDIQPDLVHTCRENLLNVVRKYMPDMVPRACDLFAQNIVCADALKQIVFPFYMDVVIGNPPYHFRKGENMRTAYPLYNAFMSMALAYRPQYICMIIPAKWYTTGKSLGRFRELMLTSRRISYLRDYPDSKHVFPDVDIAGGVCYFLWDNTRLHDTATVHSMVSSDTGYVSIRDLGDRDIFIRSSEADAIIHKIWDNNPATPLSAYVQSRAAFGLKSNTAGTPGGDLRVLTSRGEVTMRSMDLPKGCHMLSAYKSIVGYATHEHAGRAGKDGSMRLLSSLAVLPPGMVCTESYLVTGVHDRRSEAESMLSYLKTRLVRFLISCAITSQHIAKASFRFVPVPKHLDIDYNDKMLYEQYRLTQSEINFIEKRIRVY